MTKVEIRWVVDELERQSTPLSRSVLKLLQEMTSLPNRTEWVGEAFEDLHHIRNDTEILRSQMRERLGVGDEV